MASELGRLESDPLFLGLTRPAMVLGVSYLWIMVEAFFAIIYFINAEGAGKFIGVIVAVGLAHIGGLLIHSRDPKFLDVIVVWAKTWTKCTNRRYHGGRASYDVM